jgi:hypothetical protein
MGYEVSVKNIPLTDEVRKTMAVLLGAVQKPLMKSGQIYPPLADQELVPRVACWDTHRMRGDAVKESQAITNKLADDIRILNNRINRLSLSGDERTKSNILNDLSALSQGLVYTVSELEMALEREDR